MSFAACRQDVKYDSKVYDIQFLYNPWIKLNFNTGIVEVSAAKYRDKINITESDRKLIKDSFRENGIAELYGEIFVETNHPVMPPDNFQLKLIKDKKSIADIIISNSAPLAKNDVEKKILKFKNTVTGVLDRSSQFKAAKEAFAKFQKDKNVPIF